MYTPRHSSSPLNGSATNGSPLGEPPVTGERSDSDPRGPDQQPFVQATGTITGPDGAVLATFSRRTEDANAAGTTPLAVIEVAGDIDAETAPMLRTVLNRAVRSNPRVCCDLNQTDFVGADAVNTLFAALGDADQAGCVLTVRGVHGFGAHVFHVTGLDEILASRHER